MIIKYNIGYNCVIVVQSLPNDEDQTGRELYDDILYRRCEKHGRKAYFKDIYSRVDFFTYMDEIVNAVIDHGHYPLLHFEIHGSEIGFQLASKETVKWGEVASYCRKINIHLKNTLFITLATCKGASMYKALDINNRAPFWGVIGPRDDVFNYEVLRDFSSFYNILLESGDLKSALESLNLHQEGEMYKYAIITAETIFDLLREMSIINKKNHVAVFDQLKSGTKKAFPGLNRAQRRMRLKKNIIDQSSHDNWAEIRRNFLMK